MDASDAEKQARRAAKAREKAFHRALMKRLDALDAEERSKDAALRRMGNPNSINEKPTQPGSNRRRNITVRLAEAQNWRCAYCHTRVWARFIRCGEDRATFATLATFDHVIPRSMGGLSSSPKFGQ